MKHCKCFGWDNLLIKLKMFKPCHHQINQSFNSSIFKNSLCLFLFTALKPMYQESQNKLQLIIKWLFFITNIISLEYPKNRIGVCFSIQSFTEINCKSIWWIIQVLNFFEIGLCELIIGCKLIIWHLSHHFNRCKSIKQSASF